MKCMHLTFRFLPHQADLEPLLGMPMKYVIEHASRPSRHDSTGGQRKAFVYEIE